MLALLAAVFGLCSPAKIPVVVVSFVPISMCHFVSWRGLRPDKRPHYDAVEEDFMTLSLPVERNDEVSEPIAACLQRAPARETAVRHATSHLAGL